MRRTNTRLVLVLVATGCSLAPGLPPRAAWGAEDGQGVNPALQEPKEKAPPAPGEAAPGKAAKEPKIVTEFPKSLKGYQGRLLGTISAAWLLQKNVQLLWKDNKFMKNYKVGQVIFASVEWSDKALLILGAQWAGLRR